MSQFYSSLYWDGFFWIPLSNISKSSSDHFHDPIIWFLQTHDLVWDALTIY